MDSLAQVKKEGVSYYLVDGVTPVELSEISDKAELLVVIDCLLAENKLLKEEYSVITWSNWWGNTFRRMYK